MLPAGYYEVYFHKQKGFWLEEHPQIQIKEEKVYGNHIEKVDKVLKAFKMFDRNLGIMLSGDKGMGKSLFARMLSTEAVKAGLPVIVVNFYAPGIMNFVNSIQQEALILFDEFDKTFEERDDYAVIVKRVKDNIWKAEYFDMNKNLINAISEMEKPTDAQVRRIANLAVYPETTYTLEKDFNILVDEYETMTDKGYYVFNWAKLKNDIASRMTKSDCYNFIQTYDYITNYYASQELDNVELKEIKSNYIRLGEIECTRLTYLKTIQKRDYTRIVSDQEKRIRANQIANNLDKDVLRELYQLGDVDRNINMLNLKEQRIELTEEEKTIKDLVNFTFSLYACIGQEVPEEMTGILPYFVDKDKCANVSENNLEEYRNLVFTQREVIKEVDPNFNWAYFICSQSNEVLKILGFDALL